MNTKKIPPLNLSVTTIANIEKQAKGQLRSRQQFLEMTIERIFGTGKQLSIDSEISNLKQKK